MSMNYRIMNNNYDYVYDTYTIRDVFKDVNELQELIGDFEDLDNFYNLLLIKYDNQQINFDLKEHFKQEFYMIYLQNVDTYKIQKLAYEEQLKLTLADFEKDDKQIANSNINNNTSINGDEIPYIQNQAVNYIKRNKVNNIDKFKDYKIQNPLFNFVELFKDLFRLRYNITEAYEN